MCKENDMKAKPNVVYLFNTYLHDKVRRIDVGHKKDVCYMETHKTTLGSSNVAAGGPWNHSSKVPSLFGDRVDKDLK